MIRKMKSWAKNNPVLISLIAFIIVQTFINTVLITKVLQLQEALRELVFKLYPPYPTYCVLSESKNHDVTAIMLFLLRRTDIIIGQVRD